MKYLNTIVNSGLFNCIKKADHEDAYRSLEITSKTYSRNQVIFHSGDRISQLCIIQKGCVYSERVLFSGASSIINIYHSLNSFALEICSSETQISPFNYIANDETSVIFIDYRSICRSDFQAQIMEVLLKKIANDAIRSLNKIDILEERSLRNRVLVYLKILCEKSRSNTVYLSLSRNQLSEYLCVNRSALSKELGLMAKEGLIELYGRSVKVLIKDFSEKI